MSSLIIFNVLVLGILNLKVLMHCLFLLRCFFRCFLIVFLLLFLELLFILFLLFDLYMARFYKKTYLHYS
jgi:hypothetical protein